MEKGGERRIFMEIMLILFCIILVVIIAILFIKIISMRRAAEELRAEFGARLSSDTNVGISISSNDKKMRLLAADMDLALRQLRRERLRYEQGDAELKRAVINVSHDLRTPLTAVCGYMELLEEEELGETAGRYFRIMENRIGAMRELTEELFRYSVILSENTELKPEELSVNAAVEECIAAYYAAFKKAGITPKVIIPDEDVRRSLDRAAFARVLSNIVSNAIKYSDGDFSLRLSSDGALICSNHAKRLDEVSVGHLFDRFFTVESRADATGLGLSIAKKLTEQMGGVMEAEYREGMLEITAEFPV